MPDQTAPSLPEIVEKGIVKADQQIKEIERTFIKEIAQVGKNPDQDEETVLMRAYDKRICGIAGERTKVDYHRNVFYGGEIVERIKSKVAEYDKMEKKARKEKQVAVKALREKKAKASS